MIRMSHLLHLILVGGLSGAGKSTVLHVLEDEGYYCVDNPPVVILPALVNVLQQVNKTTHAAVTVDLRNPSNIGAMNTVMDTLRKQGNVNLYVLIVHANEEVLLQRFSETRRRHPLVSETVTLTEAIAQERMTLSKLFSDGHQIDTSHLLPSTLRRFILDFISHLGPEAELTLLFESFAFKQGLPIDADLVFDVRCLPNPHYESRLRQLTGLDSEVAAYFNQYPQVTDMLLDIRDFLMRWLDAYTQGGRAYLTIALGCTGGQHRSVFLSEQLASYFHDRARVLVRHRSLSKLQPTA